MMAAVRCPVSRNRHRQRLPPCIKSRWFHLIEGDPILYKVQWTAAPYFLWPAQRMIYAKALAVEPETIFSMCSFLVKVISRLTWCLPRLLPAPWSWPVRWKEGTGEIWPKSRWLARCASVLFEGNFEHYWWKTSSLWLEKTSTENLERLLLFVLCPICSSAAKYTAKYIVSDSAVFFRNFIWTNIYLGPVYLTMTSLSC